MTRRIVFASALAGAILFALASAADAHVTVDPYEWNERAVKGWRNAGFVLESRHEADEDHKAPWILMRFDPAA